MADSEIIKHSVTRDDVGDVRGAPVFHWMLSYAPTGTNSLPAWWTPARDWYLRQTIEQESFWSGALSIAVTKMASQSWKLDSDQPRVRNYFQELLLAADNNQSWVNFLSRHLMDFLCTDNGAFVEVVRATSAAGSRILGLIHLDSLRCTRTGDPDYPVIYRDTKGRNHEMAPHQIIMLSDMPDPSETYYGVGHCAASRAYRGILKLAAIESYIYEKVSGQRALAVDLVGGISDKQLQTAVTSAQEEKQGKGYVSYMGAIVVPTLSDVAITHTRINFAELPDGFDRQKEFDVCMLQYANAIGLDVQDLQPLTGRALGTGAQSVVLDEKAKGKGLAAWRQQFTHMLNQFVLPDTVTFAFDENDLADRQKAAEVSDKRATTMGTLIDKGVLQAAQAAQILADEGEIPDEFVPVDQTPGGTLSSEEKPESEGDLQQAQLDQAAQAQTAPPDVTQATKERTVSDALTEFDAAMKEFRVAMKGGFDESLHPRDDSGKFTESGGGGSGGGSGSGHGGSHGGGGGSNGRGAAHGGSEGANPKGSSGDGGNGPNKLNRDATWQKSKYREWRDGLTPEQKAAQQYYIHDGYASINGTLRHPGLFGEYLDGQNREYAKNLEASFKSLGEEVRVYRGVSKRFPTEVGTIFTDAGFVSTSTSRDIARQFSKTPKKTIVVIDLPKSARVGFGSLGNEQEVILPPGKKYRVVRVTDKTNTRFVHVGMEE